MKKTATKTKRNRISLSPKSLAAVCGGSDLTTTSDDDTTAATPILFTKCALGRD